MKYGEINQDRRKPGDDMLDKIKLAHSPLTDSIFLYRHGKDPVLALEKRDAEADVFSVLVDHMMHGAPKGSIKVVELDGKQYEIRVAPVKQESREANDDS